MGHSIRIISLCIILVEKSEGLIDRFAGRNTPVPPSVHPAALI